MYIKSDKNKILLFLKVINNLGNLINRVIKNCLFILSVPLVAIILYSVFMRYFLNMAPRWSEELARYLMVWIGFLALSVALKEGKHIGLTIGIQKLPPVLQSYATIISYFFILFFSLFVFIQGVAMTKFVFFQRSPAMFVPMWIPYSSVPVGSLLMFLQILFIIVEKILLAIFRISEDKLI